MPLIGGWHIKVRSRWPPIDNLQKYLPAESLGRLNKFSLRRQDVAAVEIDAPVAKPNEVEVPSIRWEAIEVLSKAQQQGPPFLGKRRLHPGNSA
jgi:hypothetical protein